MAKHILVLLVIAIFGLRAGAQETGKVNPALEKRFREYADALTKRDIAALDKIWAADYVFINPQGELVTKAQRLENVKTGKTEFKAIEPSQKR